MPAAEQDRRPNHRQHRDSGHYGRHSITHFVEFPLTAVVAHDWSFGDTSPMRILGYLLLVLGFLWLVGYCGGVGLPLPRSVAVQYIQQYPEASSFTGAEVQRAIFAGIGEYARRIPNVTLPAAIMLVGGVLLDIAKKRRG